TIKVYCGSLLPPVRLNDPQPTNFKNSFAPSKTVAKRQFDKREWLCEKELFCISCATHHLLVILGSLLNLDEQ
ncbi:MAG: hypothetical protein P9L92_16765, partial [Candidatus Electryonea clarkiae]|nr:hypothetical protein [Candidatus Electryonea clarkiae]